ncbi:hypothetical protein [Tistrella mobilis]
MQMNAKPATSAPAERAAWSRPVLEVMSVDETAAGTIGAPDGSDPS